MQDTDNDGLTDAYERLVSKTQTNVANSSRLIYENVISNQNPSAWFKLNNEATNGLTNAISGHAVTTLTNGGGTWAVDALAIGNSAFSFTAETHRLTTGDVISGGDTNDQSGSISLLFRALDGVAGTRRSVFWQGDTTNNNGFGVFFEDDSGGIYRGALCVQIGGQTNSILASNAVAFGAWYHLAITWDETRTNGAEVAWYLGHVGGTWTNGTINLADSAVVGNNTTVILGNRSALDRSFRFPGSGALDQIALWNRELTSTEANVQFNTLNVLFQGPSKVFDLTRWELTLPVNSDGQLSGTDPLDISTGWLNNGFKYVDPTNFTQKYFYLSTTNTIVFEAPWNGADQDGSSNSPRSELRGMLANEIEHNWKPYDPATGIGTNILQASCRVLSGNTKVIIGQIHTKTPDPPANGIPAITLYYEGSGSTNKRIRLGVYYNPSNTVPQGFSDADEHFTLASNVQTNDLIDYELRLVGTSGGTVTLRADVSVNLVPQTPRTVNMTSDPGFSHWGNTNVTLYFKAGCYFPKAPNNGGTAKVVFSNLKVIP